MSAYQKPFTLDSHVGKTPAASRRVCGGVSTVGFDVEQSLSIMGVVVSTRLRGAISGWMF
ncbi:MAG TPA: hypothetical protein VGV87_29610 [Blastocatellia bacterium]|nr:hypothetical protein [Blastocatellia bacterium]